MMMMMTRTMTLVVGLFKTKYFKFSWPGAATVARVVTNYMISLMKQSGWFDGW